MRFFDLGDGLLKLVKALRPFDCMKHFGCNAFLSVFVLLLTFGMLTPQEASGFSTVGAISQRNLAQEDGILRLLVMNLSFL
jgi:hypothetical protein